MDTIEILGIIRQNIKTKHMAEDMFGEKTAAEREAYREQFAAMTKAIEAIREQEQRKGANE
jgi:hypothetical protein